MTTCHADSLSAVADDRLADRRAGMGFQRRATLRPLLLPLSALIPAAFAAAPIRVEVWQGPPCGCCHGWIARRQANGFAVTTHARGNIDARTRLAMPGRYGSCQTAAVGGYAIEGRVPARKIKRLLMERPHAIGLAVPAMPVGSPGRDVPASHWRQDPYDVLLVARDGAATLYRSYR